MIERMKNYIRFHRLKQWYEKYERYLIPGSLAFGVLVDTVTFKSIDLTTAFSLLTVHLIVSGAVIALIQIYDLGYLRWPGGRYARLAAPLILQFTFGALLSGFLIFYWFAGTFASSWPFILIILALMISNDLLKHYYLRLPVQIGVYFFAVFSFSVLVLPFFLKTLGVWVFLGGGVFSVAAISLYLYGLSRLVPAIRENYRIWAGIIGGIFVVMNVFYFANLIPPVPLSLRSAEVLHAVERSESGYRVLKEERSLWDRWRPGRRVRTAGGRLYFFSTVFAPDRLTTDIVHRWQYYAPEPGQWRNRSRVSFPLTGGREQGFRGYSFVSNPPAGKWRVRVETPAGQVLGSLNFRVLRVEEPPELKAEKR